MKTYVSVALEVQIDDAKAVWQKAYAACDPMSLEDFIDLGGTQEAPDLGNCMRLILDPGLAEGFSIIDSSAEEYTANEGL